MPLFIKTEKFTKETLKLPNKKRKEYIEKHILWAKGVSQSGANISSGYLVDKHRSPGAGGLLVIEAESYEQALNLIKNDPMIAFGLVDWELNEWIPIVKKISI